MASPRFRSGMRHVRAAVAFALVGYGLTIVLGLVAHEAVWVGWASLALGALLLATVAREATATASLPAAHPTPAPSSGRAAPSRSVRWALAALGLLACIGTLAYNLARGSSLTVAEAALIGYGALLLAVLPWLHRPLGGRFTVMDAVAWSLPVVLAPLLLYAINGLLTSQAGSEVAASSPLVRWFLVLPTAWILRLLGHAVELSGASLLLATPRGSLTLSVGLVCAGVYPTVLFTALFGLYAWDRQPPAGQAWRQLGAGLLVLWLLNLLRMVVLAKVGVAYGTAALQAVHDQIGWVLFAAFSVAYWWAVLRPGRAGKPPALGPKPLSGPPSNGPEPVPAEP